MLELPPYVVHLGPGDSFADGCGVCSVVLAALAAHAVGSDKLGGDQPDGVAVLAKQSGLVVGAGAGLHTYEAQREVGNQRQELVTLDFGFDQLSFTLLVDAVNCKNILGEIYSYSDNAHDIPLLAVLMKTTLSILALSPR